MEKNYRHGPSWVGQPTKQTPFTHWWDVASVPGRGGERWTGGCGKEQPLQSFACFPTASYKIAVGSGPFLPLCATYLPSTSYSWSGLQCSLCLRSRTLYMPWVLSGFYGTGPQLRNKTEIIGLSQLACISPPSSRGGSHLLQELPEPQPPLLFHISPNICCWFHHTSVFMLFKEVWLTIWNWLWFWLFYDWPHLWAPECCAELTESIRGELGVYSLTI